MTHFCSEYCDSNQLCQTKGEVGFLLQRKTACPALLLRGFHKRGASSLHSTAETKDRSKRFTICLNVQIRELSAWLLLKFFPSGFPDDITAVVRARSKQLLCSPRVQEAQMAALMMKVLLQK